MLMYAYGHIKGDPLQATDIYTQAVLRRREREGSRDDGGDAGERRHAIRSPESRRSRTQNVPHAARGHGDGRPVRRFRQVAVRTPGLPAKSGVGGGLIAVSPGKFGIAVISPPLDAAGNSIRGAEGDRGHLVGARRQPVRVAPGHGREEAVVSGPRMLSTGAIDV